MSEEIGKALHSVVERVNQAAARRPKVTTARHAAFDVHPPSLNRDVSQLHDALCKKTAKQSTFGRRLLMEYEYLFITCTFH